MKSFVYFCAYPKIIADKPKLAPKRLLQNALEFCKINYFPLYLESSEGRKTRGFFYSIINANEFLEKVTLGTVKITRSGFAF